MLLYLITCGTLAVSTLTGASAETEKRKSGEVVTAVKWTTNDRIGKAASAPLEWVEFPSFSMAALQINRQPIRLFVERTENGVRPERWWWVHGTEPQLDEGDAILWETVIADSAFRAFMDLSSDPLLTIEMQWTEGNLVVTTSQSLTGRATFQWNDFEFEAWFIDTDLNGELGGPLDRWVAGPSARIATLEFPSPMQEMRSLNEPWCLGKDGISFQKSKDGMVRLDIGPQDRSVARTRHHERVMKEFREQIPLARFKFLDKQGETDPHRPTVEKRLPWTHLETWDDVVSLRNETDEPLIVEFTTTSCLWCYFHWWGTLADAGVDQELSRFRRVKIDTQLTDAATRALIEMTPATVLVGPNGAISERIDGFLPPTKYEETLRTWMDLSARH